MRRRIAQLGLCIVHPAGDNVLAGVIAAGAKPDNGMHPTAHPAALIENLVVTALCARRVNSGVMPQSKLNMGKPRNRFVAKAEAGKGWRIWDNQQKKWWGERYKSFPEHLLAELNGGKRPDQITELIRQTPRRRV